MKREIYQLYKGAFGSECDPLDPRSCMALNALLVLMAVFTKPNYIELDVHASAPGESATQNGKLFWREYQVDFGTIFEPALTDFRKMIEDWEKRKNHSFSELMLSSKLNMYFSSLEASEITPFFDSAALKLSTEYSREDIGRTASCLLAAYCSLDAEKCPRIGKYGRVSPGSRPKQTQLFLKTGTLFTEENIMAVVEYALEKHNSEFALKQYDLIAFAAWLIPYALSLNTEYEDIGDPLMDNAAEKICAAFSALEEKEASGRTTDEEKLLAYIYEKDALIKEAYTAVTGGLHFFGKGHEKKEFIKSVLMETLETINVYEKSHGKLGAVEEESRDSITLTLEQRRARDMEKLSQLRTQINNADLAAAIEYMENRLSLIYTLLIEDPKKEKLITRFFNYYLPATMKLLSDYVTAEKTGMSTENIQELKKHVTKNMKLLVSLFDKHLDTIFRDERFNAEVELSALKNVMSLDGINQDIPTLK